jgi:hypothetical protein
MVAQGYSSTALWLTTHRIDKSTWSPFATLDDDETGPEYDDELLTDVSADKTMTDAP